MYLVHRSAKEILLSNISHRRPLTEDPPGFVLIFQSGFKLYTTITFFPPGKQMKSSQQWLLLGASGQSCEKSPRTATLARYRHTKPYIFGFPSAGQTVISSKINLNVVSQIYIKKNTIYREKRSDLLHS